MSIIDFSKFPAQVAKMPRAFKNAQKSPHVAFLALPNIFFATAILCLSACGQKANDDAKAKPAVTAAEVNKVESKVENKAENKDDAKASKVEINGETITLSAMSKSFGNATVERVDNASINLPGRLTWNEESTVRVFTPFAGRVLKTLVQAGDVVKAGQPLAELASADFGQALADAKKASADTRLAQQNLNRVKELFEAGITPRKDFQQAEADAARAEIEQARSSERLSQIAGGKVDLSGTQTTRNFVLKAPVSGTVVDKQINPGQELRPDQQSAPSFIISNTNSLWVWLDANETALGRVPVGSRFTLASSAYPGMQFAGVVRKSAEFIDPTTRSLRLRGEVPNANHLLKGEMFVTATVATERGVADYGRVPNQAIVLTDDARYVFVKTSDNSFKRQRVQVMNERGENSEILGVEIGQTVITQGALYLQELLRGQKPIEKMIEPVNQPSSDKTGDKK